MLHPGWWSFQLGESARQLRADVGDGGLDYLWLRDELAVRQPMASEHDVVLDYDKVEIEDAIMLFSVDYANFRCYGANIVGSTAEAAARAASPECQLTPRNQALGGPLTTAISYDNQATIETAGADIALNWMLPFSELEGNRQGGVGVQLQATWLDYYTTKQSPTLFDVETEWKGSLDTETCRAPMEVRTTTACSARSPTSGMIGV